MIFLDYMCISELICKNKRNLTAQFSSVCITSKCYQNLFFLFVLTTHYLETRCLSHIPEAVGKNPAHFDLSLARTQGSGDWLVRQVQELISLAYQVMD